MLVKKQKTYAILDADDDDDDNGSNIGGDDKSSMPTGDSKSRKPDIHKKRFRKKSEIQDEDDEVNACNLITHYLVFFRIVSC